MSNQKFIGATIKPHGWPMPKNVTLVKLDTNDGIQYEKCNVCRHKATVRLDIDGSLRTHILYGVSIALLIQNGRYENLSQYCIDHFDFYISKKSLKSTPVVLENLKDTKTKKPLSSNLKNIKILACNSDCVDEYEEPCHHSVCLFNESTSTSYYTVLSAIDICNLILEGKSVSLSNNLMYHLNEYIDGC